MRNLTRAHLCNTLLQLCEENQLSKISVTKLCSAAGVSRQTFYNCFQDINDLVSYIPINFMTNLNQPLYSVDAVRKAYSYAKEHKGFFTQLPGHSGQNSFYETFLSWCQKGYYQEFLEGRLSAHEKERRKIAIDLYCIGVVGLFLRWCSADLSWNLETLLAVQDDAMPEFVRETRAKKHP